MPGGAGAGEREGLAAGCVGGTGLGVGAGMQAASRTASASDSFLRSGWTFGRGLPEPSHDDLFRAVELVVDLPPRADQPVDVRLVFPDARVLADHRLALAGTWRSELARREDPADLRPKRWTTLRIGSRGPALEALVDRITLPRKARSLGHIRLLARDRGRSKSAVARSRSVARSRPRPESLYRRSDR